MLLSSNTVRLSGKALHIGHARISSNRYFILNKSNPAREVFIFLYEGLILTDLKIGKLAWVMIAVIILAGVATVFAVGSVPQASDVAARVSHDTGAIFLNLKNNGFLPDCVVGVEVNGEINGKEFPIKAELHTTVMEKDIMRMVKVDKICVNPLSEVRMRGVEGEGYHIMIFGDLENVEMFHVYLKFESGKVLHFHAEKPQTGPPPHKH
uniref:Copper chaperone PCu(A)C n=1 Tax=Caldiarchaeum subterraneum TaxID=311458 RepID=A0A7C5Q476_CALS0